MSRAADAGRPEADEVEVTRDVEVRMRDGVLLRCDVYRPATGEPVPVLVQRTPYDKSVYDAVGRAYAEAGYLVVIQDVRGQFASDGVFEPWVNEGTDGFDTIEWAAGLAGGTGRVGTMGTSYQAAAQWQAALLRPPHLVTMVTPVTPADYYDQWVYPSGAFALSFNTTWLLNNVARSAVRRLPGGDRIAAGMAEAYGRLCPDWYRWLPLNAFPPLSPDDRRVAPYFFDWLDEHSERDAYWDDLSLRGRHERVTVPVLNYEGWYDVFVAGGIENFEGMRTAGGTETARNGSRIVIGPYAHNNWGRTVGSIDFGPDADNTYFATTVAWFDYWLKGVGKGLSEQAPVRYFTMGANVWQDAPHWPPPGHRSVPYFLGGDRPANGLAGGGTLEPEPSRWDGVGADEYVYDPAAPVPSIGGNGCCYEPQSPMGPYDQRPVEMRADVLVYSSPVLETPVEVTGEPVVRLFVTSSAPATDFTAKLVDVHPDGTAVNVAEGIARVVLCETDAVPDGDAPAREVLAREVTIPLNPTSVRFLPGHRVRLEISSSNFPIYDRNPNTGARFGRSDELREARQAVLRSARCPSRLELPVRTA